MAVFPDSLRKVFIGSGSIRTTGSTKDLKGSEIGLFDAEKFTALTAGATYTSNPKVILAQGSFHQKDVLAMGHGGLKESIKSRPIDGHGISEFRLVTPKLPLQHVVYIGYDTVDTTKTIDVEKDTYYKIRVTVKGSPVSRFINHDLYHDFGFKTECADDCTDNCADPADPSPLVEDIVKQINEHPYISPFVKAEAVYETIAGATPVAFDLYQLQVCDTGDAYALAAVQVQYPDITVERVARVGSISTYEICIPTADGAPDAFVQSGLRVIPNCGDCPSGYTAVGTLYKAEIKRDDAGAAGDLTQVNTDYTGETSALTTRISYEFGTSTYILYFATQAARDTAVTTPSGNDLVIAAGTIADVCVYDGAATEVDWTDEGDRYKTTRTLTLTVAKTCGGDDREADIIAFYANDPTFVAAPALATAGTCADTYTVSQYNNECLEDPCASHDVPTFSDPQSFEGQVWVADDVDYNITGTDAVGIRLTTAYVETKFGECSFDPFDHYELEIPKVFVSQVDESGDPCTVVWPVTETQQPRSASGTGEWLKRELIQFMRYKQEDFFTPQGSRFNETQDINSWVSAVDVNKLYKVYYIVHNVPYLSRRTNLFDNEQYELLVAFEENTDTVAFENLINGYTTSVGVQLKAL